MLTWHPILSLSSGTYTDPSPVRPPQVGVPGHVRVLFPGRAARHRGAAAGGGGGWVAAGAVLPVSLYVFVLLCAWDELCLLLDAVVFGAAYVQHT